jgi:hypothetical protein
VRISEKGDGKFISALNFYFDWTTNTGCPMSFMKKHCSLCNYFNEVRHG